VKADRPPERPPAFTYRGDKRLLRKPKSQSNFELHADDLPFSHLARLYDTPLYVYSGSTIRQRFQQFDQAFDGCEHTICYSVKANSNLSILRLLARQGAGFDIVSGGELQRVAEASGKIKSKVVFSGVGKLSTEIDLALRSGIMLFNVESASEMELLAARATHLGKSASFAVRVNPDVATETHPYISTGLHQHKFGVPWRDAALLYRRGAENQYLKPAGVSVHIGSQIADVAPFGEAMERVASLASSLRTEGYDIRFVDAGGGLGIQYEHNPEANFDEQAKQYAKALLGPLKSLGMHLLLEPGRAIVGPAGALLTRVIYRKRNDGKQFVVVDAAMNDLLRPSLYGAYHEIVPVVLQNDRATETVDVVGPVCESGDFLARDRELPTVQEGELLAILDAGAYGMSLASNYNSRPRPAEVLVDGKRVRLVRKRESVRELLAPERS
jgi:diaminopimelate decarboxylase